VRLQSCEKVMRSCTAQCKMLLFHAKTTMRESCNFWRNKENEETDFVSLVTFWFGTFKMLFSHQRLGISMSRYIQSEPRLPLVFLMWRILYSSTHICKNVHIEFHVRVWFSWVLSYLCIGIPGLWWKKWRWSNFKSFVLKLSNFLSYIKARQACNLWADIVLTGQVIRGIWSSTVKPIASLLIDFSWFTPWNMLGPLNFVGSTSHFIL